MKEIVRSQSITNKLVIAWNSNDKNATKYLFRRMAQRLQDIAIVYSKRFKLSIDIDADELVNDLYIKMHNMEDRGDGLRSTQAFIKYSRAIMRNHLLDRLKQAKKTIPYANDIQPEGDNGSAAKELELVIDVLTAFNRHQGRRYIDSFEMYFQKYTQQETSEALGVSIKTVQNDIEKAKRILKFRIWHGRD